MDIGTLTGQIAIEDQVSGHLTTLVGQVTQFAKDFDGALGAVAIGAGAAVAAIAGVTAAVTALGIRGADVNDLRSTLEQFAGGAKEADEVMRNLREGTRDTVTNFDLLGFSSKTLQARVKLSADEFKALGQAADVMSNRGLGSVNQQLEVLSQALITGRTRSLEMRLGLVGTKDAIDEYATAIGKTKDQLTEYEMKEARRAGVMNLVNQVAKDATAIQSDFGDRIQKTSVMVKNFFDELASGVDDSPVIATAMDGIGEAIMEAFGTDSQTAIEVVMNGINQFALLVVDAGIAAVEAARVINVAWSVVKTVVLGVTTAVIGLITGVVQLGASLEIGIAKLRPWDQEAQNAAASARTAADGWKAMTASLADQTEEAAKGVIGQSAFDAKLDKIGGTLFNVRDRTVAAMAAAKEHAEEVGKLGKAHDDAAGSVKMSAEELKKWEAALKAVDDSIQAHTNERLKGLEDEGVRALKTAQAEYDARIKMELDMNAVIQASRNKRLAENEAAGVAALGRAKAEYDRIKQFSTQALQAQANEARRLYEEMAADPERFSELTIERFKEIAEAAQNAADGVEMTWKQAFKGAGGDVAKFLSDAFTGGGGIMGAVQGLGSTWGAKVGKMLSGIPIIGPLMEGIGALVGPLIGKVKDLISKPEWKKLAADTARDWGVTISDELAKAMEEDSKKFGRAAAQLLSMDKIIEEAGGVEKFGVTKAIDKLRSAFSWFEMGELTVEQLGEVMDENFGDIIPHALGETSGLLSKQAAELIDLAEQAGVTSQAMRDFLGQQLESTLAGLSRVTVTSERAAQSTGAAIAAAFGEMIRQGATVAEALAAAAPAVDALESQLTELGFDGGAAFAELRGLVALASDEIAGPMIDSVAGVGQALAGLQNTGILTQDMFVGLAGQVADTFSALVEQGYDGNQALLLMQPSLQTIWELQQDFGYAVDEGTQALLDQAREQGLVGEQMRDVNERILNVLTAIAEVLGADLPEAAATAGDAIENELGDLNFEVDVRYNYDTSGEPDYASGGGLVTRRGVVSYMRSGGMVPKGSDTVPAMLTPGERVLSVAETKEWEETRKGGGDAESELAGMRRDMLYVLPEIYANATIVALSKAGMGRNPR